MKNHLSPQQKEAAKHGETFFPLQKYLTLLNEDAPVVMTHWHEEAEFTLITEGHGSYWINLSEYHIGPGDLVFVAPLLLHSCTRASEEAVRSRTFVFHLNFLGGNATDICATRYLAPIASHELALPCVVHPDHPAYSKLKQIFQQSCTQFDKGAPGYELALKALLLQAIFLLLPYGVQNGPPKASAYSEKLKNVLDYIGTHYAEALSVSDLAGLCFFSEYHFMRFFKKHMSMTCIEYINNFRLEKAVELFESGNTSILEVSLSVGFSNLSYFHRVFKKKYHITPLCFLRQLEQPMFPGS